MTCVDTFEGRLSARREAIAAYVQECQEAFEYEDPRGGGITFGLGPNQCPAALLYHPTGYTAVVSEASEDLLASDASRSGSLGLGCWSPR